jgi:hypothetical protein
MLTLQYTLPKYPHSPAFGSKAETIAPTDGKPQQDVADAVGISLKNSKSPTHSMELSLSAKNTSVYDLKAAYSRQFSVPEAKIKVLDMGTKRPVPDSKLVDEFVKDGKVEFGIMLLGVTPTTPTTPAEPVAATSSAEKQKDVEMRDAEPDVLETKEFWNDLESWLGSKLEDKTRAKTLARAFKQAAKK